MPFVTQEHRLSPDRSIPGDCCYLHYKRMVDTFRNERRWTTAHNLYKEMLESRPYKSLDESVAEELAWQVFFTKHVMAYENQKENENGTI